MDRPNNLISTLLCRLQTCISTIVSSIAWESLTPEETHAQNDLEFLCVDVGLVELESNRSETSADGDTLRSIEQWIYATEKLANSGKLDKVNYAMVRELLESIQCDESLDQEELTPSQYNSVGKPRLRRTQHVSTSLRDASKSLFHALVHSSACCCGSHTARMHLNGFGITDGGASAPGFVFFLSSTPGSGSSRWQETSCQIHAPAMPVPTQHVESTLCLLLERCGVLGEPLIMTLHRAVDDTPRVIGKPVNAACGQDFLDHSLGELIDQRELIDCGLGGKFPRASKASLCRNLAFALIHLSSREWVPHLWDVDNIFFARDRRHQQGVAWDTNQPYLSRRLETEENSGELGDEGEAFFSPAKSRLLSFAQVVMEVYTGVRLAKEANSKGEKFQSLRKLVSGEVRRSVPMSVLEAVQSCIDFVSQAERYDQPGADWLFTKIILKLDKEVRCYDPISLNALVTEPAFNSRSQKRKSETTTHTDIRSEKEPKRARISSSFDWFQMFEGVKEVLSESIGDNNHLKTKIAILDTGLTAEAAAEFQQSKSKYRDFTAKSDDTMHDATGHGTSIFELVCRVCENADIFVARVWEGSRATANTVQSTIQALEWAMKNNVDIICMASGFHSELPELREALLRVFAAKILIFAAASNHSNRMGVAYPARWDDLVFCMFSTNSDAKNSRSINPAGLGSDDFAIFGENVQLYSGLVDSGTSYATAVACGFAARLLDFSRQEEVVKQQYGKFGDRIREKRYLTRVFRDISSQDEGYRCIVPWRLLPEELQGQFDGFTDEEIRDAREKICIRISRCAESSWL